MAIPQPTAAPAVHLVKIAEIKKAKWNPKARISERRLMQLRLSVDDLGLYYPVLLDRQKNLIDGHRRLAVAESFRWTHIPAITVDSTHEGSYGSVQLTQQKLSGNDILGVYLVEPKALLGTQRSKIAHVEKKCGLPVLKSIYDAGLSAGVFGVAKRVAKYIGSDDVVGLTKWVVRHRIGGILNPMMKGGIPPMTIAKAFNNDKTIKID